MVLHCPACGLQHIDAPDEPLDLADANEMDAKHPDWTEWTNPPHRSHLCAGCGHIWRPADVPTEGVVAIQTRGKNDSPPVSPSPSKVDEGGEDDPLAYRMAVRWKAERQRADAAEARLLRAVKALEWLEATNEALCRFRPLAAYHAYLAAGGRDRLLALDEARRDARAVLSTLRAEQEPDKGGAG